MRYFSVARDVVKESEVQINQNFSLNKYWKVMADTYHVPYFDDCCDIDAEKNTYPVRYNYEDEVLEYYNGTTELWTSLLNGGVGIQLQVNDIDNAEQQLLDFIDSDTITAEYVATGKVKFNLASVGSIGDLQAVTDVGAVTTNSIGFYSSNSTLNGIFLNHSSLGLPLFQLVGSPAQGGMLLLSDATQADLYTNIIKTRTLTANRQLYFPNSNGTLVTSINGVLASTIGDVSINAVGTANNGITLASNNFKLGGTLINPQTKLTMNANSLVFEGGDDDCMTTYVHTPTSITLDCYSITSQKGSDIYLDLDNLILSKQVTGGLLTNTLIMNDTSLIYTETITTKLGIQYSHDTQTGWTGRSLVTKDYVDLVKFGSALTGTTYTLLLTDVGKLLEPNNALANLLTVPANASVAFPIGTQIDIIQKGAGQTTFVAAIGVTINAAGGLLSLNTQYSSATLIKIATNTWYLVGDLV